MRKIVSYRTSSPFVIHRKQPKQKTQRNETHQRISKSKSPQHSICIDSTRKFDTSENQMHFDEFISNQFMLIKNRTHAYCTSFNTKFNHNQSNQSQQNFKKNFTKMHKQRFKAHPSQADNTFIRQIDAFRQLSDKIEEYIQENTKYKPQCIVINKKQNTTEWNPDLLEKSQENSFRAIDPLTKIQKTQIKIVTQNVTPTKNHTQNIKPHQKHNFDDSKHYEQTFLHYKTEKKQSNTKDFDSNYHLNSSSTISQVLYKEAQRVKYPEYRTFCQRILLEKRPILSEMHFFKKQKIQITNNYLGEIYKKINLLNAQLAFLTTENLTVIKKQSISNGQRKNIGEQIDEICIILKKMNQIYNLNSLMFSCNRPCCKFEQKSPDVNTKAKILINLKQSAKQSLHYKTDATDQYFMRYYKKSSFDKSRIYSLSKTKTQQMETLQKSYKRNKDRFKSCRKRCNSLFSTYHHHN